MCFQVKVVLNRVSYDQPMFLHITDAATRPSNAFGFMFSFIVTFFLGGGGDLLQYWSHRWCTQLSIPLAYLVYPTHNTRLQTIMYHTVASPRNRHVLVL